MGVVLDITAMAKAMRVSEDKILGTLNLHKRNDSKRDRAFWCQLSRGKATGKFGYDESETLLRYASHFVKRE